MQHVRLLLAAAILSSAHSASAAPPRPDLVLILADDMGWSDPGCFGGEIGTPNLDGLARNGLRFTQFYNTARCCPTRASLLTGLYPHQAGIGHMTDDRGHDGYRGDLSRSCVTLAEVLRPAGYATYMCGKWHVTKHLAPDGPKDNWPRQRGFDRFFGTIMGGGSYFDPATLTLDNTQIAAPAEGFYYTDEIAARAAAFIADHQARAPSQPLFLYAAFTAPHWPMHAKPGDIARYRGRYDAGWDRLRDERHARQLAMGLVRKEWLPDPADRRAPAWDSLPDKDWFACRMEVYAAMVDGLDQGIGRIVQALKDAGRLENTLVVFLSDNGGCAEEIGSQGARRTIGAADPKPMAADELQKLLFPTHARDGRPVQQGAGVLPGPADTYLSYGLPWAHLSNTPFREYKHWTHEGGVSAPFIAHWPRGIPAARRNALVPEPAHLMDLMATFVDLSGAAYPRERDGRPVPPMEGVSLRPAFDGRPLGRPQPIFWEHEGNRAVREGRWKIVAFEDRPWELYDMDADRTEQHDLAAAQPDRVRDLAAKWDAWAARANVLPLGTWRGKPPAARKAAAPARAVFELKAGDTLAREDAPAVGGRGFRIVARVDLTGGAGVVVSQGGVNHGYALHVEEGQPCFSIRRAGALTTIRGSAALRGPHALEASLALDGRAELKVEGLTVASGAAGGPLPDTPIDGLCVGREAGDPVGAYSAPHPFAGTIHAVRITLADRP